MSGSAGPPKGGAAMDAPANRRNTSANGRPGAAGAGPSANCGATAGCDAVADLWAAGNVGIAGPEVPRPDVWVSAGGVSTGAGRGRGLRGRGAACVRPAVQRGCGCGVGTGTDTGGGDGDRFGTTWAGGTGAKAGRDGSSDSAVWGEGACPSRRDRGVSGGTCNAAAGSVRGGPSGDPTAGPGAVGTSSVSADEATRDVGGAWMGGGSKLRYGMAGAPSTASALATSLASSAAILLPLPARANPRRFAHKRRRRLARASREAAAEARSARAT